MTQGGEIPGPQVPIVTVRETGNGPGKDTPLLQIGPAEDAAGDTLPGRGNENRSRETVRDGSQEPGAHEAEKPEASGDGGGASTPSTLEGIAAVASDGSGTGEGGQPDENPITAEPEADVVQPPPEESQEHEQQTRPQVQVGSGQGAQPEQAREPESPGQPTESADVQPSHPQKNYSREQLQVASQAFPALETSSKTLTHDEAIALKQKEHARLLDVAKAYGITIAMPPLPTQGPNGESLEEVRYAAELTAISLARQLNHDVSAHITDKSEVTKRYKRPWKADEMKSIDRSEERARAILDAQGHVQVSFSPEGRYVVTTSRLESGDPNTYSLNGQGEMVMKPSSQKGEDGKYPETRIVTSSIQLTGDLRRSFARSEGSALDAIDTLFANEGDKVPIVGRVMDFAPFGERTLIIIGNGEPAYTAKLLDRDPTKPIVIDTKQRTPNPDSYLGDIAEGTVRIEGVSPNDVVGYPELISAMNGPYLSIAAKQSFDRLTGHERQAWFIAQNIQPNPDGSYPEVKQTSRAHNIEGVTVYRNDVFRKQLSRQDKNVRLVDTYRQLAQPTLNADILDGTLGKIEDPAILVLLLDSNLANARAADEQIRQIIEQTKITVAKEGETRSAYAIAKAALYDKFNITGESEAAPIRDQNDQYARVQIADKIAGIVFEPTSLDRILAVKEMRHKPGEGESEFASRREAALKLLPSTDRDLVSPSPTGEETHVQTADQFIGELFHVSSYKAQFNGERGNDARLAYAQGRGKLLEGATDERRLVIEQMLPPILEGDGVKEIWAELGPMEQDSRRARLTQLMEDFRGDEDSLQQLSRIEKQLFPAEESSTDTVARVVRDLKREDLDKLPSGDVDKLRRLLGTA